MMSWSLCIWLGANKTRHEAAVAENKFLSVPRESETKKDILSLSWLQWWSTRFYMILHEFQSTVAHFITAKRQQSLDSELHLRPPAECHTSPCSTGHALLAALWPGRPFNPPCQGDCSLRCFPSLDFFWSVSTAGAATHICTYGACASHSMIGGGGHQLEALIKRTCHWGLQGEHLLWWIETLYLYLWWKCSLKARSHSYPTSFMHSGT